MSETSEILPPPLPVSEPPASSPEQEPRSTWRRLRWVLVVTVLAFVLGGLAVYATTRPDDNEELVDDLEGIGLSESDAEQMASGVDQLADEFDGTLNPGDLSDGHLTDSEVEAGGGIYMIFRDTEVGQLLEFPDESAFTDAQVRTYAAEACAIARDSDSMAEYQIRIADTLADEPNSEAAASLGGGAAAFACLDALEPLLP